MDRRTFITLSAAGALALVQQTPSAHVQAPAPSEIPYGQSRLGISDNDRDGTLYVPKSYKTGVPMPVMMLLHGFAGTGEGVRGMFPLADSVGPIFIRRAPL